MHWTARHPDVKTRRPDGWQGTNFFDLQTVQKLSEALLNSGIPVEKHLYKEVVRILASFCVWKKSLMCKDVVNMDSTCQNIFRRLCTAKKIEDFRFPVSHPDDVSSRPDVHLSTVPSVRTTCSSRPDAKQTSIISPDDVSF
jgi:hypothetical protein